MKTNGHELKALQVKRHKLYQKLENLRIEQSETSRAVCKAHREVAEIDKQIERATQEPTVSEHALLRYIERAYSVDLEEMRQRILTDELLMQIKALGAGKFPIGDGLRAVVRDNVVVSVIGGSD